MELQIVAQRDSSITKDLSIPINLGNYTILAGENNAGKSNIIDAIKKHPDIVSEYEIIEIPAENNNPKKEELKISAATAPFYKVVEKILNPFFSNNFLDNLVNNFNNSLIKQEIIEEINLNLFRMGVDKKKLDIKIPKEQFKEDIIIKLSKAIVKDLYNSEIEEVDIDNIGMGTQRLIVTALIQYYEKSKISDNKKTLIIFEEPEIYLHPSWKKSLHESLLKLSDNLNIKVLITTHDPYFIELGKKQNIYQVFRDGLEDSTNIKRLDDSGVLLPYKSDSEINYLIFNLPSRTYFLEIYEYFMSLFEDSDEKCEGCGKLKSKYNLVNIWIREQNDSHGLGIEFGNKNSPKVSSTRHALAHKGNEISEGILKTRIEELKKLIFLKKESVKN